MGVIGSAKQELISRLGRRDATDSSRSPDTGASPHRSIRNLMRLKPNIPRQLPPLLDIPAEDLAEILGRLRMNSECDAVSLSRTSGSASAELISRLSRVTTSRGVPAGAMMPNQPLA